ncbi:hypothetical protein EKO23_02050 [Nocardioides guangzhouensis]|uniref:Tissue inhibitor of metalloproteinase n=1 Tax=Nocardioides guangzhouensis TaxID=2497878 RepID=A0A4V1Y017_9ACTN|nr:hypothetical protein [Nocardioides guangzhouensis]RYP88689.1 hypothetical protein EKO23_02050 [Nocardioides guangzhouensis]
MRRLMVLVLVVLGCVLVTEAPASACDRDVLPLSKALPRASYVFSGTVQRESGAGDPATFDVAVDRVYRGRVPERVSVETPATGADCGVRGLKQGKDYLFVARNGSDDVVRALSWEGTRPLTAAVTRSVVGELGRGARPVTREDPAQAPVEMTMVDTGEPAPFSTLVLPGVALIVLGLVTLVLARVLGRRPARG